MAMAQTSDPPSLSTQPSALPPAAPTTQPQRKKFATPPVKIACLSCRASRTRCNGERPCASCVTKGRECIYKPSRRGGPRIRKKTRPLCDYQDIASTLSVREEELPQNPLPIENYIDPGAGLKSLADVWKDSDAIYDDLFKDPLADIDVNIKAPMVRTYGGNSDAIRNAYYLWIHPYFPILPAPERALAAEQVVPLFENQVNELEEPPSAVSLAISAILALIPCPDDANPLDPVSVAWRRKYSQFLAKSALESIESENERPESSIEPSKALSDTDEDVSRERFHPDVPVELESIIALDVLSVYEYAQRGNLKKMRTRAGSALVSAMSQYLHKRCEVDEENTEARRRVWWMTYLCVSQASVLSNTEPTFEVFAPSFTAKYPIIQGDPEAWSVFIQGQQAILAATQFVIKLNKARKEGTGMSQIFNRMQELERFIEPLVAKSETWVLDCPLTQPVDRQEIVVSQSLKCLARIKLNSARIKIHRYCAFFDIALFTGRHCDLTSVTDKYADGQYPQQLRSCCTSLSATPSLHASQSPSATSSSASDHPTPKSDSSLSLQQPNGLQFPFTRHESAKICLKSALSIAESFDLLPYPNPTGQSSDSPCYIGPGCPLIAPRTMPTFACCAMQSAYVLLMVKEQTESLYPQTRGDTGPLVDNMLSRLQQGLWSIWSTLVNYSAAFEALSGMQDQVQDKMNPTIAEPPSYPV